MPLTLKEARLAQEKAKDEGKMSDVSFFSGYIAALIDVMPLEKDYPETMPAKPYSFTKDDFQDHMLRCKQPDSCPCGAPLDKPELCTHGRE